MKDRFGNELDIAEIFEESELSTKDRNKLDDSDFGIPELRKYPLTDESHVLQAVRFFNKAPEEYKPELARNIVKRAKELHMEWENWDVLKPYLDKPVKESYVQEGLFNKTDRFSLMKNQLREIIGLMDNKSFPDKFDKYLRDEYGENEEVISMLHDFRNKANTLIKTMEKVIRDSQLKEESLKLVKGIKNALSLLNMLIKSALDPWLTYEDVKSSYAGQGIDVNTYWRECKNIIRTDGDKLISDNVQESFDEMFGKKVSLKNMYQESSVDMMKVDDLEYDELYFGSDTKYPVEIDLNRPLFVTPLKGIASIFVGRADLKGIIPKGSYNLDYKEWRLPDKELMKPLKTVHVYVEGYPDLKEQEITLKGYIHCIPFKYYKDNIYRYPWMSKGAEYLIANTENMKVEFTRIIECEVKYIVKGVPSDNPKYGPDLKGYLELAKHIAKKISIQVKNDSKPPTGNQNCQLCTWCAEAQFRGMKVLPRPVYSPRDPALKIIGEDIVHQPRRISLKQGYDDFLDHLMDADTTFARWYCHINWKGSTGGHEFLLIKIDKKFYIMDSQSGKVETLDDTHDYFKNINWDNSYICRFDNKAFNYELLEKTNDPSKTLPWDPKKDIPYMLKNGMISKEEADESKTIQEGAMNDVKNGVNPFSDKRIFHVSSQGHLDGQVFNPRVPEYLDKYDPTYPNFEDVSNPRVCFSTSIEGALNAIVVKLSRWKPDRFDKMYVYVPEKPLKEYKHTSNKDLIKDKKVYDANLTREIWIEEPVRLKLYGVIRVDQVSKSSKKLTVPMLNGKRGDRDYHSFKWHWVVKPQVLKNIPFEYSPEWVCRDMIDDLKGFKYGIPVNGEIKNVSSSDYYDKNYKSLSPEEFEKYKGGICWDYVEWEEGYLKAYGYDCKKYYIFTDTEDSDTHTFITVDDGKGGLIYPESSFSPLEGVHKIKNVEEAIKMIADKMFSVNNNDKKYDEIKYYVWEYSGHPPYGSNTKQCTEYYSKGEPFYEGVAKNKKE